MPSANLKPEDLNGDENDNDEYSTADECPGLSKEKKREMQTEPPGPFSAYDKQSVEMCLNFACAEHMKSTNKFTFFMGAKQGVKSALVFSSHITRFVYPKSASSSAAKKKYGADHKKQGQELLNTMEKNKFQYQETDNVYNGQYKKPFDTDWPAVERMVNTRTEEGGFWWRWVGSYIWGQYLIWFEAHVQMIMRFFFFFFFLDN